MDVAPMLASPDSRKMMLGAMGQHDPLMKDALTSILERGDFIKPLPNDQSSGKSKKACRLRSLRHKSKTTRP
ncbi:hypothetical protein AAAC51_11170 [Priestia megaterium]